MKRIIIVVTLLLLAGFAGWGWKDRRRERSAAEAARGLATENRKTREAIQAMEQRLAATEQDRAASSAKLGNVPPAATGPQGAALSTRESEVAAIFRKSREQEKDPKVQSVRLASRRARLMTSHGVLFAKLGLTTAQIGQFQDIAARRDEQNLDLDGIVESEREQTGRVSAETKAAVDKFRAQVKEEAATAQKQLLGEEGFAALKDYNRTVGVRTVIGDLAGAAVVAGVPFSAGQAEQLTQVLADACTSYRTGGTAYAAEIDWTLADEQARGVLAAPQMQFFQTVSPPFAPNGRFARRLDALMAEIATADAERAKAEAVKHD